MNFKLQSFNVRKLFAASFAAACLSVSACDSALLTCNTDECDIDPDTGTTANNLIEAATEAGNFSTLLAALESASLQQVLSDPTNTYTLFAPTDAAFAAVGEAELTALLADGTALTDTLLYHVVPGAVNAATATGLAGSSITMENNKAAMLTLVDGALHINDANITTTDIVASNGIIHAIDTVLTPPAETVLADLVKTVNDAGNFTTLSTALETSGLDQLLANEVQTFTIFAPTDEAFAALGQSNIDALLADASTLNDTLLYHVRPGSIDAEAAMALAGTSTTMQNGQNATLSLSGEQLMINTSNIITTDILATNGVIHVIDTVLTPPDTAATPIDLIATLTNKPNYSTLVSYLQSSGLATTLADEKLTYTIFAPTNAAFLAADAELQATYAADATVLNHLLQGHMLFESVIDATTALELNDTDITMDNGVVRTITVTDSTVVKLDNATVVEPDITAANGIIHGIDTVLLP